MKYPFVRFTACTAESNIPESPDRKHAGYIAMHGKMIIKIRNKYNTNINKALQTLPRGIYVINGLKVAVN